MQRYSHPSKRGLKKREKRFKIDEITFFQPVLAIFKPLNSIFLAVIDMCLVKKHYFRGMNWIYVLLIISAIIGIFLVGRSLYHRSVRLRNQLMMGRVFTNISHELLTPLTVVSASVERMRSDNSPHLQELAVIDLNIDRMVRLLQEILETSKSLAGETKLRVAQADVMRYIRQTALCLEPLMARRNIEFTVECEPESMMGWIDTDKLDKIIYNLVSNAAKYSHEGGRVAVKVVTNKKFDSVTIKVIDNGIGISKEKMKRLFQRFYDGDYRQMQTIGTGLGLSLTRDLVYLNEGTIDCESEEGVGTTFTVTLPIVKKAFRKDQIDEQYKVEVKETENFILDLDKLRPKHETKSEDAELPAESADEDTYRILVVEDNLDLLMLMQTLLSQHYVVSTARNGIEALEVIQKTELDLIISDVMMPEMDGNELTRAVKADPSMSHLPIILLTARTQEKDRELSMRIGADDYVTKPFRMGELMLRINNIIENRKRIRREFKAQTVEESRLRAQQGPQNPDEIFMQKAIDCVYKHLADGDLDRDAFAAEMGASASTLYNRLRSLTGMNVSAFIRDIRMKEAKRLAQTTPGIRVSDLAYKVGFKDPKYFATCFKKEFGIQPSEFIEQVGANS